MSYSPTRDPTSDLCYSHDSTIKPVAPGQQRTGRMEKRVCAFDDRPELIRALALGDQSLIKFLLFRHPFARRSGRHAPLPKYGVSTRKVLKGTFVLYPAAQEFGFLPRPCARGQIFHALRRNIMHAKNSGNASATAKLLSRHPVICRVIRRSVSLKYWPVSMKRKKCRCIALCID